MIPALLTFRQLVDTRVGFWGMPTRSRKPFADELGGSTVETAVVLPVLLVILTGLLSVGVYLNNYLELGNATSLAGEYLSESRSTTPAGDPCNLVYTSFTQVAPFLNPSNLHFTLTMGGTSYPGTSCTGAASAFTQGANAVVKVTYPCSLVIWGTNLAPTCNLSYQVTEIVQ